MRMALNCARMPHTGFSMSASGKTKGRGKIAAAAGVTEQAIYFAQSGRKANGEVWLKNVFSQAERNQKPGDVEQRCICCGTIRAHSEYGKRGNRIKKKCEKCERGFYNGGKLTWEALDKMRTPSNVKTYLSAYSRAEKGDSHNFPYLMLMAYRLHRLPNSLLEERFNMAKGTARRAAGRMGITDPSTKVCPRGEYHHRWKGYENDLRLKTWGGYWQKERLEFNRATRAASWDQHELSMRWEWRNKYHSGSPELKIKKRLRKAISQAIRQQSVKKKTSLAIGCDVTFLRKYLESRFKKGMTWENYGSEWHIDHIKPLDSFELRKKSEQAKANHYTNLQPLWALDNISKGNKTMKQDELF